MEPAWGEPQQLVPGAGHVHKCGEPVGGPQRQDGAPFYQSHDIRLRDLKPTEGIYASSLVLWGGMVDGCG
jgi:hypothetical protein